MRFEETAGESRGRMLRAHARWTLLCIAGALVALTVCASAASASTQWVSHNTPSAPFNSCEHPGYTSIQAAINGPSTAIHVCGGTYDEQLQVERALTITGYEGATVAVPSTPANSTTPCDVALEGATGLPDQDVISVCGSNVVKIKNLNIQAVWPGEPDTGLSCAFNLFGVLAANGATLELSGSTVAGARPQTINGCQYGVGVQLGDGLGTGVGAKLLKDVISEYQKNGITVEGSGTNATIASTTVTGAGPVAALAQNGIGVQEAAHATITSSTISRNECENSTCGPDALSSFQSAGVYFYNAGIGSTIKASTVNENDVGVEAFDEASAPPSILSDKMKGNRYESIDIGKGGASITGDTMSEGDVGIEVLQYAGEKAAPSGTATRDTITSMSKWAVLGRSDKSPSDPSGTFSITSSKISGNPGPHPQESVEDENSPSLRILAEKDS